MNEQSWQQIETAPKNGTAILAIVGSKMTTVKYEKNKFDDDRSGWHLN